MGSVTYRQGDASSGRRDLVAAESADGPGILDRLRAGLGGTRPVIVTVTLNAALDRTVRVPNFQLGARHRADSSLRLPGGKGVNIARALKTLGQPVIATGLAGGRVGTYIIEELTAEGILNDFVRIQEESRTSTAVIDPTNNQQTEINEWGPSVQAGRARGAHRQDPLPVPRRRRVRARRVAAARRADRLVRARPARAAPRRDHHRGRRHRAGAARRPPGRPRAW